jgi:hypothetical protein
MDADQTTADQSVVSRLLYVAMTLLVTFVAPCLALGWVILQTVTLLS